MTALPTVSFLSSPLSSFWAYIHHVHVYIHSFLCPFITLHVAIPCIFHSRQQTQTLEPKTLESYGLDPSVLQFVSSIRVACSGVHLELQADPPFFFFLFWSLFLGWSIAFLTQYLNALIPGRLNRVYKALKRISWGPFHWLCCFITISLDNWICGTYSCKVWNKDINWSSSSSFW